MPGLEWLCWLPVATKAEDVPSLMQDDDGFNSMARMDRVVLSPTGNECHACLLLCSLSEILPTDQFMGRSLHPPLNLFQPSRISNLESLSNTYTATQQTPNAPRQSHMGSDFRLWKACLKPFFEDILESVRVTSLSAVILAGYF